MWFNRDMETNYRLATSHNKGNVGIRTGSTPRPGGRSHLWNPDTERTACGRAQGQMYVHNMPCPMDELLVRVPMCRPCMKAANR